MKNLFFLLILLSFQGVLLSQQNIHYYDLEGRKFISKSYELGVDENPENIPAFEILLPDKKIKDIRSVISSAIYDIDLYGKSKIVIIGSIEINNDKIVSGADLDLKELDKMINDQSLNQLLILRKNRLWLKSTYPNKGIKLKENRKNSVVVKDGFLVLYLNVCNKDLNSFNSTIESFKVI